MKQILITQAQFEKAVQKVMHDYTDKMRKYKYNDGDYDRLHELSDVLTMSISFALLEYNLFNKGGESDEGNE